MGKFVGDSVLVSPMWNWGTYYTATVKAALDGTWATHQFWGGLASGVAELSALSPKVPKDVADLVDAAKAKIVAGSLDIFAGPLKDNTGAIKVADKAAMTDGEELGVDWFVEGVVGKVK